VAARKTENDGQAVPASQPLSRAPSALQYGAAARFKQLLATIRIEYGRLMKTVTFIVLTSAALLNCVVSLIFNSTGFFGVTSRPVTYAMIDLISGTLYAFLIAMITFFAGVLIWEERDARTDEVHDALPVPEWPGYVAKFIALMTAIASIQALVIVVAICVQAAHHYTRFQIGLYVEGLLGRDLLLFAFFVVLYASSQVDKTKMASLASAITNGFQELGVGAGSGVPASSFPAAHLLPTLCPPALQRAPNPSAANWRAAWPRTSTGLIIRQARRALVPHRRHLLRALGDGAGSGGGSHGGCAAPRRHRFLRS